MNRAHGVDVSQWQGQFDPTPENLTDIDFIILKVTQSDGYIDPGFSERDFYKAALKAPIQGAYHYYRSLTYKSSELMPASSMPKKILKGPKRTVTLSNGKKKEVPVSLINVYEKEGPGWQAQADFLLKTVKGKDFHFFAIDIEYGRDPGVYLGRSQNTFVKEDFQDIKAWIDYVRDKTGKRVLLYTNPNIYYNEVAKKGRKILADSDLWLAAYLDDPQRNDDNPLITFPIKHRAETDWNFWQYSADGNFQAKNYGATSNHIDLNVFNGSVEALRQWLSLDPADLKSIHKDNGNVHKESNPVDTNKTPPVITNKPPKNVIDPVRDPEPQPVPADSIGIQVTGNKTVLRKFNLRDKAGKPIMQIPEPRIRLDRGSQLLVSATHKESKKDSGDGIVKATGNILYYSILDHPYNGSAAGYFIQVADVTTIPIADFKIPSDAGIDQKQDPDPVSPPVSPPLSPPISDPSSGKGIKVEVSGKKAVLQAFSSKDKTGKPIMQIPEPRIRLDKGSRLIVAATRSESSKDKGDGIINATGNIQFYFITDDPSNGKVAGLYVRLSDVKRV